MQENKAFFDKVKEAEARMEKSNTAKLIHKQETVVSLNEVEEKLKSMRQKRLSRLNTFVDGQSALSEKRNGGMDEAILSIQKTSQEKATVKPNFKRIVENVIHESNENIKSPKLLQTDSEYFKNRNGTIKKSSKKILNKFNCIHQGLSSSNEDLATEEINLKINGTTGANVKNQTDRNSLESNTSTSKRKTVYAKENEEFPVQIYNASFEALQSTRSLKNYENVHIGKNETDEVKLKELNLSTKKKSGLNISAAPRSPVPLPRKTSKEERILRKLQINWTALNEILENGSNVDLEEMEDFTCTLQEAAELISEYDSKITGLKKRIAPEMKLNDIRAKLCEINISIQNFRGLKRDMMYIQLSNRLSGYFLEIGNMETDILEEEKKILLEEINESIKQLELKVACNENILLEILEDQVNLLASKIRTK